MSDRAHVCGVRGRRAVAGRGPCRRAAPRGVRALPGAGRALTGMRTGVLAVGAPRIAGGSRSLEAVPARPASARAGRRAARGASVSPRWPASPSWSGAPAGRPCAGGPGADWVGLARGPRALRRDERRRSGEDPDDARAPVYGRAGGGRLGLPRAVTLARRRGDRAGPRRGRRRGSVARRSPRGAERDDR